ncbi:hypothetical protein PUR34_12540 [Streptomyces sp. JV185]|uniref:hypothetical protein n=1 Tax=Streptomyces sp. JV185 TaxID=858638 RepID=UPI002E75F56B|nr:hypothetical protein [Streptomyces sp. JV185]MEE1768961.1 hypothetical protein [Streptomyces sp. JV185]
MRGAADQSIGFVLIPARTSYPADGSQRYEEVFYEVAQRTERVGSIGKSGINTVLGLGHQAIDTIGGIGSARTNTTSTPGTGHRAPGTGHRAPGTGHRAPGTGHRAPGQAKPPRSRQPAHLYDSGTRLSGPSR